MRKIQLILLSVVTALALVACSTSTGGGDGDGEEDLRSSSFTLSGTDASGEASFEEDTNGMTMVRIALQGAGVTGGHPASIREGNEEDSDALTPLADGDSLYELEDVDAEGKSETELDVDYDELLKGGAYIDIQSSATDSSSLAQSEDLRDEDVNPSDPADPEDPSNPEDPSDPEDPADPENPEDPEDPTGNLPS